VPFVIALASLAFAQPNSAPTGASSPPTDPGPRSGAAGAGNPLSGLSTAQLAAFADGSGRFQEVEAVTPNGLGPRFNSNSCASCHASPAIGGTSPANNPQMAFANGSNTLPSFIQANGPVREARFIKNSNGDGGVHDLFVIAGRSDAPPGCSITQENYSNTGNISMRIPTPTFGLGLIEAIPDAALVQNLAANAGIKAFLGISGHLNHSGNDGSVTRFGWKAQNKSLTIFAGEAYNVEMGITNLLFPNERDDTPNCSPAASPQDSFNLGSGGPGEFDDVTAFASFMRFLAPPAPGPSSPSVTAGSALFIAIGCGMCHTPTLQTGASSFGPAFTNQTIHPYSDFALHDMGPGLADQISQGQAAGDEFRTAPLWGLGQRLFFLHDGRTSDLLQAIEAHSSRGNGQFQDSEANTVIQGFNAIGDTGQQAILDFLRSL
jgi:CxxC motif-containing protein (DUF1111 family)